MQRWMMAVLVAVVSACGGSDGATGPAGPTGAAGVGTRLTYAGAINAAGEAAVALPLAAGSIGNLPIFACYISQDGATWLPVTRDSNTASPVCGIGAVSTGLAIGLVKAPPAWRYTFVVVY